MADKTVVYCWDTSVFLAWLGEETGAPLANIELVIDEIDKSLAVLLVPVTAYSEVLEFNNTPKKMEKFRKFLERSNIIVADVTKAIAEKAGEIRSRGLAAKPKRKIKTPDATFMATAIIFRADVFHTCETEQLPNLSGTSIVDKLKICSPGPISGHRALTGLPGTS
jgi:hypothetical protein